MFAGMERQQVARKDALKQAALQDQIENQRILTELRGAFAWACARVFLCICVCVCVCVCVRGYVMFAVCVCLF